ncbi:type III secretion system (T3SS) SseB-like protein [Motilibacter rhizosphaerae]|uniref:Type III secretion system (T3SS) SseB-like protein n=1 Tax=Motilibacter rhizosphaerae TaxID=598652 RepID=A0A4Q7NR99_9ACTN|nr:SseB family protein [Motilibacter rhizosphaerae]RZS89360.1 type III secretion system (T3SS) SseB-like protein [Motilibacter rhizosphaerae]
MSTGRGIPDPGFAGDAGGADPVLREALDAYAADPARAPQVRYALSRARVLVPVVAVLVEEDEPVDGLRREKATDMALVTLAGPDGRRALPAFTSLATLAAWRADARPVPVEASRAALSAAAEGAEALVLDPAGPVVFAVTGPLLRLVAEEGVQPPLWADDAAPAAVRAALADVPEVVGVRFEPLAGGDARLVLRVGSGRPVREVLAQVAPALQGLELLQARVLTGLDIAVEQVEGV